jgi:hypothetical protein
MRVMCHMCSADASLFYRYVGKSDTYVTARCSSHILTWNTPHKISKIDYLVHKAMHQL